MACGGEDEMYLNQNPFGSSKSFNEGDLENVFQYSFSIATVGKRRTVVDEEVCFVRYRFHMGLLWVFGLLPGIPRYGFHWHIRACLWLILEGYLFLAFLLQLLFQVFFRFIIPFGIVFLVIFFILIQYSSLLSSSPKYVF